METSKNLSRVAKIRKYANDSSQFYLTYRLFEQYAHYDHTLSYEEWCNAPESDKAALLYVQFYPEILLAWNKTKAPFNTEEDGVEVVLQYLNKNVKKIEENPSRFTCAYIYRVAYNCIYCIARDIKRDKDRYRLEMSNIQVCQNSDDEVDLFQHVFSDTCSIEYLSDKIEFWRIVESIDPEAKDIIEKVLSNKRISKATQRKCDEIFESLRDKLEVYKEVWY